MKKLKLPVGKKPLTKVEMNSISRIVRKYRKPGLSIYQFEGFLEIELDKGVLEFGLFQLSYSRHIDLFLTEVQKIQPLKNMNSFETDDTHVYRLYFN